MSTEINIRKRIDIQEEGVSITPDVSSINFTGAGVTASTVGDNVTVNVQGSVGATAYYLNQTVTQAPYKEFSSIPTLAAEQTIATVVGAGATATIQSFQTPSGVPNTTNIPAGLWQFYLHFSGTLGDSWDVYAEVYKRDLGGIETLLLTTDTILTTTLTAIPTMILTDGVFPASTVLTTDRIVVKVLAINLSGVSKTITFHTEGSTNYSVGTTTLNQIVPTGAVTSVTGTAPVVSSGGTTPAISMPQANGTTDGYLDSADWTTFNGKVPSTRNITINGTTQDLSADRTWSVGTVTSAGITAGTGISLAGTNPITSSGSITVTNSAPDQTVVLNNGAGIGVSGTYPNFTVTNTDTGSAVTLGSAGGTETLVNDGTGPALATKGLTAGSGVSLTGTASAITIANTDPGSAVTLTSAGGTESLVNDSTGPALATKGVTAGTGISLSSTSTALTVTNSAPDQVVALTPSTGINVTGTYPNFTIANTAPDQTVALTAGTGIGVTGTYPNFTISNTDPTTGVTLASSGGANSLVNDGTGPSLAVKGLTAGSGILIGSTATAISITNSNPDQTVVLNSGTGINVTGTYPNFTVSNTGALSNVNIYNSDGIVTGDRQVDLAGNDLFFNDGLFASTFRFNSDDGSSSTLIDAGPSGISIGTSGGGTGKNINVTTTQISLDGKFTVDNTKNTSGQNLDVVGQTKTTTFQMTTTPTAGYVLTSDASGNGTWSPASDTNIYNTDGTLSANRTVTMNNFGLTFNGAGGANGSQINISAAANRAKALNFTVGSGLRWKQQVSGTEIGGDNGSQLAMLYYDDAGALKGTAFSISRTDGAFRLNNAYSLPLSGGTTGQVLTSTTLGLTAFQSLPAEIQAAASDETTNLTTGTAKVTFRMPHAMTLTAVRASLTTAQTAGALLTVDINLNGVSVLGTKLTFDNTEKTTVTAATPATIVTSALTDDGEITVDIDVVGTAGAKGLKITLIGTRA